MLQLLQGLWTYIQSFRGPLALVVVAMVLIAIATGHRMWALAIPLVAMALLFTLATLLQQLGLQ
jgi:hypothetical protein